MAKPRSALGLGLGLLVFLLAGAPAFSQSCALCYTQASSAGARMIEALRSGILVLVLPPTFASVAMLFVVHRKSNQMRRMEDGDNSPPKSTVRAKRLWNFTN